MIDVVKHIDEYKRSKQKIYPCHANRASQLGDECERRLVYYRIAWEKQVIADVQQQYVFDEGNNQEEAVLNDLRKSGIIVIEQQRPFSWPEYKITGTIDCRIMLNDEKYPCEIKSMSPYIWDNINTVEDLKKYPWTSKYLGQMLIYLLLGESEEGIMIFKNKSTGRLKQITISLNDYLGLAEFLIKKAVRINKHVREKTLPGKLNEYKICKTCPFRAICLPEILTDSAVEFLDHQELEDRLDKRDAFYDASQVYNTLDKNIKEDLKRYLKDKQILVVGKWTIEKKVSRSGAVSFDFQKDKQGDE